MRIWQYIPSDFNFDRQQCVEDTIAKKPKNVEHTVITKSSITLKNLNMIKCKTLIDNPNDVWIEPDMRIKNWWVPPNDGFIYVTFATTVIFINGEHNRNVFSSLYDDFVKTDRGCRWLLPQLIKMKAKFKIIHRDYFQILMHDIHDLCQFQTDNANCKKNILFKYGSIDLSKLS